jgi:hypothetical protein
MTHSFNVEIAQEYGMNAAVIFNNIFYWCEHNRANGKHEHDGLFWTYNSRKAFAELFPYLSERQVRTALDKLIEEGLIVTGNYNTDPRDRTTWYAVTKLGYCIGHGSPMQVTSESNASDMEVQPLPDSKPTVVKPTVENVSEARAQDDPPTVEEANKYAEAIGYTGFNAEGFVAYYAARGWRAGGSPIIDWRAMVRAWRARDGQFTQARAAPSQDYAQREYRDEDFGDDFFVDLSKYGEGTG